MDSTDNDPGNVTWTCDVCKKVYKSETWYKKHLDAHHGGGSEAAAASSSATSDSAQCPRMVQPHLSPDAPLVHHQLSNGTKKMQIKPPIVLPSLDNKEWAYHNEQLQGVLSLGVGKFNEENVATELQVFDDLVYDYFYSAFRSYQPSITTMQKPRQNGLKVQLRKRKRLLRKQLKVAKSENDSVTCRSLARSYRSLLKLIQEVSKRQLKGQDEFLCSKNEAEFDKNPYRFSKQRLDVSPQGLTFTKEVAEDFFKTTYQDLERTQTPGNDSFSKRLDVRASNTNPPGLREIENILRKTRNGSTPGPNGLPYLIYKRCPVLRVYLQRFFAVVWRSGKCPESFGQAVVKLIPKVDGCDHPSKTRPIALTNTHGKIFFSVVSKRLYSHLELNDFLLTRVQKGFTPNVSGCLEHTELLSAALKDARQYERQIYVLWLDLGNAFGSVKHNLLQWALHYYSVPIGICQLIYSYYDQLSFLVKSRSWETSVFRYEKGLFQGCTLSPVAFTVIFNLLLERICTLPASGRYCIKKNGLKIPHCMAFADDLTLVCRSPKALFQLLEVVENFCNWSGCLYLKPSKCCYLALKRNGAVFGASRIDLRVAGELIPPVEKGRPFKFLGKFIQCQGKPDVELALHHSFEAALVKVDKLPISGPRKVWIYNNVLISRLSWPFLIYHVTKSLVDALERKATAALKRWLGLHRSMDVSMLYRSENNFGFGLARISTLSKQFRITKSKLLVNSMDPLLVQVSEQSCMDLSDLQSKLAFEDKFMAGVSVSRQGLGYFKPRKVGDVARMRSLVQREDEQSMLVRSQGLEVQHDWAVVGEFCIPPKLLWRAFMYEWSPAMLKFYANAMQSTLPDPSNLAKWSIDASGTCQLCSAAQATARHILVGCPKALDEGRYTWRHNRVLGILREAMSLSIAKAKRNRNLQPTQQMVFVRPGQRMTSTRASPSIMEAAVDWIICVDAGEVSYEFPPVLAVTSLRPDLVVYSLVRRLVVIVELTVPWETNIPKQHLYKLNKYESLCSSVRQNGFRCHYYAVEVGARGLPAKSVNFFLKELGLGRKNINQFLRRISKTSLEASFRLWGRRSSPWGESGEGRVVAT